MHPLLAVLLGIGIWILSLLPQLYLLTFAQWVVFSIAGL